MYIFQPDRYLLRKQIQKFSNYITGKVLDVGAGSFDRYQELFTTESYTRMEIKAGPGIDVVGTAYDIPFPDNSFDSVISTQVFEHLARPIDAAKELYRVLKRGGHALVTVPQANELHEEPHDYFRYTDHGLKALFGEAGFTIVEIDKRGGYWSLLAQMKIRHAIDRFTLYDRPVLGKVAGKYAAVYGRSMILRDQKDQSEASRKHAIGWCVVLKK